MPVIALQGIRGGVGTTSVTAALAWAFQQLEEPALVIDFCAENQLRMHFNTPFEQPRGWARAELDGDVWLHGALRYAPILDLLPFGHLNADELARQSQAPIAPWAERLAQLRAGSGYRWILLDVPAGSSALSRQLLALADCVCILMVPDANCQIRLHQQALPSGCRLLLNQFSSASLLQKDLYQLWLQTLPQLLPMMIHRDEAMAEALAVKQPLGEYHPQSLAANEVMTLANWCLIHLGERT